MFSCFVFPSSFLFFLFHSHHLHFSFYIWLCPLLFSLHSFSASVFLSPSIELANDSAGAEEMDGVSIFRTREGGQTKSKRAVERGGREGCEEKINLHSATASGQRQLELQGEAASLAADSFMNWRITHICINPADWYLRLQEQREEVRTRQRPSVSRWVWNQIVQKNLT